MLRQDTHSGLTGAQGADEGRVALSITLGEHTCPAWGHDLSAQGLSLTCDPLVLDQSPVVPGQTVGLRFVGSPARGLHIVGVVTEVVTTGGSAAPTLRLGVCFLEKGTLPSALDAPPLAPEPPSSPSRRRAKRYLCPEFLRPMATASSPFFYGDFIHFQVLDVGKTGMGCEATQGTTALTSGLELTLTLTWPMGGTEQVKAKVAHVTPQAAQNRLRVGFQFVDPAQSFLESLSAYLLFIDRSLTPQMLQAEGLCVPQGTPGLHLDHAHCAKDFEDILQLRLKSYQKEGHVPSGAAHHLMASPFDTHSRHMVARYENQIVAASRLTFVEGIATRSHLASVCHFTIPRPIWEATFMEWGNLIINPRFQKGGLVRQMAHFVSKTARQCGGGYLLGAADKHLAPLYLSLGFEIIDTKVVCPFPGWEVDSCCLALFLKS